jgi:glycosyltransferase involved in cell wall biosynthesis
MILSIYTNCSMGGMATVYRNRAAADPSVAHLLVFLNDHGGAHGFRGLDNVEIRIVPRSRVQAFIGYLTDRVRFDEVRITSLPELVEAVTPQTGQKLVYEFHSSDEGVLKNEITKLDVDKVQEVVVPSAHLQRVVARLLSKNVGDRIRVVPNLVDSSVFKPDAEEFGLDALGGRIPLLWIGRFDKGKNVRDFIRVLACLPDRYAGIAIVSLESDPSRISDVLADVNFYGLQDRFHIMLNLSQQTIAGMYVDARNRGGALCSTSLGESFGYSVAEALASGLPAVAYDVGAIGELVHSGRTAHLVPIGDILGFVAAVQAVADPVWPGARDGDVVPDGAQPVGPAATERGGHVR